MAPVRWRPVGGFQFWLTSASWRVSVRPQLDILVATPGRLQDHLTNTPGFAARLLSVQTLILARGRTPPRTAAPQPRHRSRGRIRTTSPCPSPCPPRVREQDEGDQLLDQGFRPAIERIVSHLPRDRQSLCFSATVPPQLAQVLGSALRPGFVTVNTVEEEEADTHDRVDQSFVVCEAADQLKLVLALIREEQRLRPKDHKVIVFFPTANQTKWAAEALEAAGVPLFEIHSRRSQSQREKASAAFRAAASAVMLSSDVSARGVDYPDVSLVVQCGMASSREQCARPPRPLTPALLAHFPPRPVSPLFRWFVHPDTLPPGHPARRYVHRLGRTGRAGKPGRGVLLIHPFERFFLRQLGDLPLRDGEAEARAAAAAGGAQLDAAAVRLVGLLSLRSSQLPSDVASGVASGLAAEPTTAPAIRAVTGRGYPPGGPGHGRQVLPGDPGVLQQPSQVP